MENALATFVNVILPLPLAKLYTYRVPSEFITQVAAGKRVIVQFGRTRLYSAIIYNIQHLPPKGYEAKNILSVLDDDILVTEKALTFWNWMSEYYMCSMGDVMNAALPSYFKLQSETKIKLNTETDINSIELSDKEYLIVEALTTKEELTLAEVAEIIQVKNVFKPLQRLYQNDVIILSEEIKESYKPKTISCVKLNEQFENEHELEVLFQSLEKKPKQLDLLVTYLHLKNESEVIQKKTLLAHSGSNESSLKTLETKGIFSIFKLKTDRILSNHLEVETFDLNEVQTEAFNKVKKAFTEKDVALLFGITSSGKTHIYVKLIEEALALNKQVLFLLPEIALTSQIVARVKKYFGDDAIAFHSKFTQNERVELWRKIQNNEAKVIIGARSAIFLPFSNLGLVIVDEEHDQSYKQYDPAPRYHARDAAIYLAHIWKCKTILGSATPSFESYFNCKQEKFALIEMKYRYGNIEIPKIVTANLAEEKRVKTMKGIFTSVLYDEIENALSQNDQVILFQNRRGYSHILQCEVCQWTCRCTNCDINLTYHKTLDLLKCHYCGYTQNVTQICPACNSVKLDLKGLGTEKIEDEIKAYFPNARVSRLDLDTANSKNALENIIQRFENHEADILVGTQMVSKGLDFSKVNVVGIINADQILNFPDFRAHERAYQLLSQVSGRAGRRKKQGKVIIQTSSPDNIVIQEIINGHFENIYNNEMAGRLQFHYPPHSRLIKLIVKHKEYAIASESAFALKHELQNRLGTMLIGPESPFVSRIRNYYIKEMLLKLDKSTLSLKEIKHFIAASINKVSENKKFRKSMIYADVDPA
ncbi:MAG: primosomal protein N' [Bacteroidota bacterium]